MPVLIDLDPWVHQTYRRHSAASGPCRNEPPSLVVSVSTHSWAAATEKIDEQERHPPRHLSPRGRHGSFRHSLPAERICSGCSDGRVTRCASHGAGRSVPARQVAREPVAAREPSGLFYLYDALQPLRCAVVI